MENLESDPAVIYWLDPDLRIVHCNAAWDRFALQNGGHGLERVHQVNRPLMDVIAQPLKNFYAESYGLVLSSGKPFEYTYECSSALVFRTIRMMTYPDPERDGLIVVNSVEMERPHDSMQRPPCPPAAALYRDKHGIMTACCHCRRTRRARQAAVWDWVPGFVDQPPEAVSHGICEVCMNVFYPKYV